MVSSSIRWQSAWKRAARAASRKGLRALAAEFLVHVDRLARDEGKDERGSDENEFPILLRADELIERLRLARSDQSALRIACREAAAGGKRFRSQPPEELLGSVQQLLSVFWPRR
jgi:hypothetical protein